MDKYQEALQRARKVKEKILDSHLTAESREEIARYIDEIIPELAESEDERIRKRAIVVLKQQRDYWSYDGPMDKFPPATPRKDLALTWEDIREIDGWISVAVTKENLTGDDLYKEVLQKFNESRKKK